MSAQSAQTWFHRKTVVASKMPGSLLANRVQYFCSMLAWEFIHGLLGNNEQGPKLTGTVINPQ